MKKAVYPGSFDPCTYGHIDIIQRGSRLFDELYVTVMRNSAKKTVFTIDERLDMLEAAVSGISNVRVTEFSGLLTDYVKNIEATYILKGLRAVSDFEYEFQMAITNHGLADEVETVFMPASADYMFLSSSIVREIARYGGELEGYVPPQIAEKVRGKFTGE